MPVIDSEGTVYTATTTAGIPLIKIFRIDTAGNLLRQNHNPTSVVGSEITSLKYDLRLYNGAAYIVSPYGFELPDPL